VEKQTPDALEKGTRMALSNAQRRWWDPERRPTQTPRGRSLRRHDRRSHPQRWTEAVETLQELQEQYHEWLQSLSASRHDAALAEKLRAICALDLAQLDVELP
jgi:hypothetical protein